MSFSYPPPPQFWELFRRKFQELKSSQGGVLFLILIAVALFAALAYGVTQSTRSGGGDTSKENGQLIASQLDQYFSMMRQSITRMRVSENVQDYEVNFVYGGWHKNISSNTENANCTTSRCRVYDPAGGNVTPLAKNIYKRPSAATDVPALLYVSVPDVGTSASDVAILLQGVKWEACLAINQRNNISQIYSFGYPSNTSNLPYISGSFPMGSIPTTSAWTGFPAGLNGKTAFCYCETGTTQSACEAHAWNPQVIYVLMER